MLELSHRAEMIPASPIRKLVTHADLAKSKGIKVYHLNIGQPDLATPQVFWDAIAHAEMEVLAYSHSAGMESLREAILTYYARHGHRLGLDDIIVTTGASEALNFLAGSIINPGDEIIIPEPFYANYVSLFIAAGAKVVPIPTDIEEGFRLPEPEAFERAITPRTKALLVCNPGNPTGTLYPESALRRLEELVLHHDLFLLADEVYREFVYDGQQHFSVLNLPHAQEHVILVDSISKRFSACGARIGCIISRNQAVMNAVMKLAQIRLASPTLDQIGARALYELPETYFEEVVSEYIGRRDVLIKSLNAIPGVFCPQVAGAFYAMVKLPVDDAEAFCQWMLTDFTYQGATVMMAPGAGFYNSPGAGKDQVRIAYVLQKEDLKDAINCLAQGILAYPGVTYQHELALG